MICLLLVAVLVASASARSTYIVGGSEAEIGKWKYQISLRLFGSHTCGGSLISSTWVVCASHCVAYPTSAYSVIAGMHDQAKTQGQPEEHDVFSTKMHPNYIPSGNYPNDISVIKLKTPVNMKNPFVQAAMLAPNDGFTYSGSNCYISGWGLLKDGGSVASKLQESPVDCLSNIECQGYWGSLITSGHVCIFDKFDKSVSACNGDSGGPLHCQRNGQWYVVGVASWVAGGCNPAMPGAYTRVSQYRDWVRQETDV